MIVKSWIKLSSVPLQRNISSLLFARIVSVTNLVPAKDSDVVHLLR